MVYKKVPPRARARETNEAKTVLDIKNAKLLLKYLKFYQLEIYTLDSVYTMHVCIIHVYYRDRV